MPNPKRRHSKTRQAKRRTHTALSPIQLSRDPRTGKARLPHRLHEEDTHYGFKKGGVGGFEVRPLADLEEEGV